MSSACQKISANVLVNCTTPIQGGTKDTLYLFNFDDIEDATISVNISNDQIVEDITLLSGITGYKIEGKNNSVAPKATFVKQRFGEVWDHEVNFKAFDLSPATKQQIEKMKGGRLVAVVENNYKGTGGNAAYEVLGLTSGLVLTTAERDPGNADTQGAYDLTLKTSEFSKEANLPATFFNTDYATTKAIIEALIV